MEVSRHHQAPVSLHPGNNTDAHSVGGWMGHRASLCFMEKRKSLAAEEYAVPF